MLITNYSTFPSSSLYYTTFDMCATRKNQQLDISYIYELLSKRQDITTNTLTSGMKLIVVNGIVCLALFSLLEHLYVWSYR